MILKNQRMGFVMLAAMAAAAIIFAGCSSSEPEAEAPKGAPPETRSATQEQRDARAGGRGGDGGRGVVNN